MAGVVGGEGEIEGVARAGFRWEERDAVLGHSKLTEVVCCPGGGVAVAGVARICARQHRRANYQVFFSAEDNRRVGLGADGGHLCARADLDLRGLRRRKVKRDWPTRRARRLQLDTDELKELDV